MADEREISQEEPETVESQEMEQETADSQEPQEDATNWQQVAQDRYDQLVRLQADFDNFRRRMDREREELRGFVTGAILKDFLPVYDNLERALKYMPEEGEAKAWRAGLEMTLKGFNEVFTRFGVTPIETVGLPFDPRVHEAVQQVDSAEPEGTIVEELLKGFQWREQVLRASLVKVSTGQGASVSTEEEALPE
ncbi:MAG: nucleotide exchange factor GrpE [Sulfobacillus thermosulfidooxidans]|uniref:Protein GrpE n=1 Tax=Sulfobacillus thermotolerans TaxID=338644 RepID=A0ABM6RPL6_9FIRM|nr:nucleotide exchange factor GrpE [Sulfobacillus sp. hq2]AUW93205.1 nucleotide exchange factor GrpE [Sulfobacillus thermotolerans]MCY0906850.1 nucleotide exchange factor GrpE [Sulfobacillus thermotolerans]POB11718.1 nucleotide exchange factor GrpE [Sulfobacillus sp. hq2]PSR36338.1 MAG: nucleotide exchange factor GrpE [Sulfobacillus thermosulfidooxidans]